MTEPAEKLSVGTWAFWPRVLSNGEMRDVNGTVPGGYPRWIINPANTVAISVDGERVELPVAAEPLGEIAVTPLMVKHGLAYAGMTLNNVEMIQGIYRAMERARRDGS